MKLLPKHKKDPAKIKKQQDLLLKIIVVALVILISFDFSTGLLDVPSSGLAPHKYLADLG